MHFPSRLPGPLLTPLLLAASSLPQSVTAQNNTITCSSGLHLIVARGTTEPEGPGSMGAVAEDVADQIPGSDVVGLVYPATFTDPLYTESVIAGALAMKNAVEGYVEECPGAKLAVLGYSQGAQVSLNALCGGGVEAFAGDLVPVERSIIEENVVAIILFGDPSHTDDAEYSEGTADTDGIFSRLNVTACEDLGSRLRSYCDEGDTYCDRGDDRDVHGEYVDRYGESVAEFIVSQYEAAEATTTPTTSSGAAEPTGEDSTTTTREDEPTGSGEEADPEETDSGAAGLVMGWAMGLVGIAAWQLL